MQLDISGDLPIGAERLRSARRALDRLVGRDLTEECLTRCLTVLYRKIVFHEHGF